MPKPDYDGAESSKDKVLPKVNCPTFAIQSQRRIGEGFGGYYRSPKDCAPSVSVVNDSKAKDTIIKAKYHQVAYIPKLDS